MDTIWIILTIVGSLVGFALLLDSWAWGNPRADAIHFAHTSDGWDIAIHELKPVPSAESGARPVILCHGIVMSRRCWLPHRRVPSVARKLQRRGYWLWVVELRGSGQSRSSRSVERKWSYPFTFLKIILRYFFQLVAKTFAIRWVHKAF